jgi:bla regulator protein BlaR1
MTANLLTVAGNHLLQSTVFAVLIWLITLLFRRNAASVRHALWVAASLKFLVPFTLLTVLGGYIQWPAAESASVARRVTMTMIDFSLPLAPAVEAPVATGKTALPNSGALPVLALGVWFAGFGTLLMRRFVDYRRVAASVRNAKRLQSGPEIDAVLRAREAAGIETGVDVRSSEAAFEPGVFGILRPVLVLPVNISARVPGPQLETIAAHELCHVGRRDNLTAALHVVVEALFWFHPLVWFIGARLIEERERACDEAVVRLGADPEIYSAGILNVCKLYIQAPAAYVAGVTGSDLRRRIENIMAGEGADKLTFGKKILLACAALLALAAPVLIGVANAPLVRAQATSERPAFEVATIKPSAPDAHGMFFRLNPGGRIEMRNQSLKEMIVFGYRVQPFQISGGPAWLDSVRYDVIAKAEKSTSQDEMALMVQSLLADRFQLKIHREAKELSRFALVLAAKNGKLGPGLTESKEGSCAPFDPSKPPPPLEPGAGKAPERRCGAMQMSPKSLMATGVPIDRLIMLLSRVLGRTVVDGTGLTGNFDISLEFTPDDSQAMQIPGDGPKPPASDTAGPSIYIALQEQLGLKLESQKGPVDILIVDRAEKPSEN